MLCLNVPEFLWVLPCSSEQRIPLHWGLVLMLSAVCLTLQVAALLIACVLAAATVSYAVGLTPSLRVPPNVVFPLGQVQDIPSSTMCVWMYLSLIHI